MFTTSAPKAVDPGFDSRLRRGDISGSSHTSDLKIGTPVATLTVPGVTGLAPGLVGAVSVYCDWVGAGIAQLVVLGLAVHSVAGSILLWGHFPVEGIFPLELTWVQTPFPQKTPSDESVNRGLVCAHMHFIARTQKILTFMF